MGRAFCAESNVRITRLERDAIPGAPALLGDGRLLDPLELGEPARLAVDDGPVLVTEEIVDLSYPDHDVAQVQTSRCLYRLELLPKAG